MPRIIDLWLPPGLGETYLTLVHSICAGALEHSAGLCHRRWLHCAAIRRQLATGRDITGLCLCCAAGLTVYSPTPDDVQHFATQCLMNCIPGSTDISFSFQSSSPSAVIKLPPNGLSMSASDRRRCTVALSTGRRQQQTRSRQHCSCRWRLRPNWQHSQSHPCPPQSRQPRLSRTLVPSNLCSKCAAYAMPGELRHEQQARVAMLFSLAADNCQ